VVDDCHLPDCSDFVHGLGHEYVAAEREEGEDCERFKVCSMTTFLIQKAPKFLLDGVVLGRVELS
jgi:hypothetical protein